MRHIVRRSLPYLRAHTALAQFVGVIVCLPPLIFPGRAPVWSVWVALLGLALLLGAGYLLSGRPLVRTPLDVPILLLLILLPVTLLVTPDQELTLPHVYKVICSVAPGDLAEKFSEAYQRVLRRILVGD